MGRKVKNQTTGELADSDTLYKVTTLSSSGRPITKYYSDEASYNKIKENSVYYKKCIETIMDMFGYEPGMKFPTTFSKRLSELKCYGYKVVYDTIARQTSSIQWALDNKRFKDEYGKISYVMSIIENHVLDEYKLAKKSKIAERPKQKEIAVDDLYVIGRSSKPQTDISSFIEDLV